MYDQQRYMEQVKKEFNTPYDPRKPVEVYFMKLQEACQNAKLLGTPFSKRQTMGKALKQFKKQYKKDTYKAKKKWNEKTHKIWAAFKTYWKNEIHQWETVCKSTWHANQVVTNRMDELTNQVADLQINLEAMHFKNQSIKESNNALITKQIHFSHALQAEQQFPSGSSDDFSTITDYINCCFDTLAAKITNIIAANATSGSSSTQYHGSEA